MVLRMPIITPSSADPPCNRRGESAGGGGSRPKVQENARSKHPRRSERNCNRHVATSHTQVKPLPPRREGIDAGPGVWLADRAQQSTTEHNREQNGTAAIKPHLDSTSRQVVVTAESAILGAVEQLFLDER